MAISSAMLASFSLCDSCLEWAVWDWFMKQNKKENNGPAAQSQPPNAFRALSYAEKLRDPRWQKIRLQVFERDNFTCQICLAKDETLHVHHCKYHKELHETPVDDLITLCETCHKQAEEVVQMARALPQSFGLFYSVRKLFLAINGSDSHRMTDAVGDLVRSMVSHKAALSFRDGVEYGRNNPAEEKE